MSAFHDLTLRALDGQELPLAPFKGKVVLVVNVASKCGLTPQYAGLEKLYQEYRDHGFSVLGLPCNQFAGQEPDSEEAIKEFCTANYGVSFPLASKIEVNGAERHPLYRLLAGEGAEFPGDITWNFEKFLVGPDGRVLARFSPRMTPEDPALIHAIESSVGITEQAIGAK
ncbi:glutathione peroxidase [Pseudomonas sp. M30-35]|uniref:glutathione peroxidase n=1 Tax=unclassified Pseudomonas TaxID=196821 RepID=UPI000B3D2F6D|nr:glutathione peroxidase [Pseudomonas sp. M30-35]ARU89583.1 glutathione peroxidase [Pseudomonas sp. M30-35]